MTVARGRYREDAISNIFVDTSRVKAAFARIDELMERGWEAEFCRALLLLGPARCGKTHILKEWLRRRMARAESEGIAPFKAVVAEVPAGCTLKGMAAVLLSALDDPDPDYGSQTDMTRRIHETAGSLDLIVIDEVQRLMERGWEAEFCRALLLLGPARCGKTHILKEWLRRRMARAESEGIAPFKAVVAEVPAGCTLKGMAAVLLSALDDPDPDYGSQTDMTRRIHETAGSLDLIVIDEVQRLMDAETGRVKKDVANWLTGLLNQRICPLLLVGERHAEMVFQGNMYLEGRTLGQVPVDPYDWHEPNDRNEFRIFLNMVDGQLGMEMASGLGEMDTALRIHAFSGGRVGQATLLVDEARSLARRRGAGKMSSDMFATAVDLLRVGAARQQPNPFRVETPIPGGSPPPNVRDVAADVGTGRTTRRKAS